jgi:hypothetical protein
MDKKPAVATRSRDKAAFHLAEERVNVEQAVCHRPHSKTMPLQAGASAAAAQRLRELEGEWRKGGLKVGRAALLSRRQRLGTRVSTG